MLIRSLSVTWHRLPVVRAGSRPPDDHSSSEFSSSVQVHPFRPFQDDMEQMVQRTFCGSGSSLWASVSSRANSRRAALRFFFPLGQSHPAFFPSLASMRC